MVVFVCVTLTSVFVFGGTTQVPSSLRYFAVPAVLGGAGTRPCAAEEPDLTKSV